MRATKDDKKEHQIECCEVEKKGDNTNVETMELLAINFAEKDELSDRTTYSERIQKLISDYKPAEDIKTTVETRIVLPTTDPIYYRPRRLAPKEKEILSRQIDRL